MLRSGDIAAGLAWLVIGFALCAVLYAAGGALVNKVTEVCNAVIALARACGSKVPVHATGPDADWKRD